MRRTETSERVRRQEVRRRASVPSWDARASAAKSATRQRILRALDAGPMRVEQLHDQLGLGSATIARHVRELQGLRLIRVTQSGRAKVITPLDRDLDARSVVAGLDSPMARDVFGALSLDGSATSGALALRMGVSRRTVSHHLRGLRDRGLIVAKREGRTWTYSAASTGPELGDHTGKDAFREGMFGEVMR